MDLRPECKYGKECYRQNDQHRKQYQHPTRSNKRKRNEEENISEKETAKRKEEKEEEHYKEDKVRLEVTNTEQDSESENEDDKKQASQVNVKEYIKSKYLVDFPDEMFLMWDFCVQQNSIRPKETFTDTLNLKLVGPFDILAGNHKGKKNQDGKKPNFLLHWRYYYDPPELTTMMIGDNEEQFHIGYYRDDPNSMPDFVASNSANENGCIQFAGETLFSAVKHFLEERINLTKKNIDLKKIIEKQLKDLCEFSEKKNLELNFKTMKMKRRDEKVVCKTLHGAGIVVSVDENGVGYRPVPATPGELKRMFKRIVDSKTENERHLNFEPLQELITYIQFANDECDYGEGLELGLDLFTYGGEVFHSTILTLLPLAYQLLGRPQYSRVIETHLRNRKHTSDLSQLD